MAKGWGKRSKGRSNNKKQRDAADATAAAAELAELARSKRKRAGTDGGSPKRHKHMPQHIGRGGAREKLCSVVPSSQEATRTYRHRVAGRDDRNDTDNGVSANSDLRRQGDTTDTYAPGTYRCPIQVSQVQV